MPPAVEQTLADLGLSLPTPATPLANYVPFTISGNLLVVSGQGPIENGRAAFTGKLGETVSVEQGQQAARLCFLNVLAQVKAATGGDWGRVRRVLRLGGFIAAPPSFTQHAQVMNGASDLAVAVFGDAGRHARTTVGVPSLPADFAVEVEAMLEIS